MNKTIEDYHKKAEENLREAEKVGEEVGDPRPYERYSYNQRLLIAGTYYASLANYYVSRALIEVLSKKK